MLEDLLSTLQGTIEAKTLVEMLPVAFPFGRVRC